MRIAGTEFRIGYFAVLNNVQGLQPAAIGTLAGTECILKYCCRFSSEGVLGGPRNRWSAGGSPRRRPQLLDILTEGVER
jgi:hypothetical protein